MFQLIWWPMQVVEIGKGSKVKYELDKKTGMIMVIVLVCYWISLFLFWISILLTVVGIVLRYFSFCRLIAYSTHLWYTPTIMVSSLAPFVKIMILWMCWFSCRYDFLVVMVTIWIHLNVSIYMKSCAWADTHMLRVTRYNS